MFEKFEAQIPNSIDTFLIEINTFFLPFSTLIETIALFLLFPTFCLWFNNCKFFILLSVLQLLVWSISKHLGINPLNTS